MNGPSYQEDEKAFRIRCAGKTGQRLHPDDIEWIAVFYKKYPKWSEINKQKIHEATKPFGAK